PNVPPYYLAQRPTFLDQIVTNSKHIHWVSTQFTREYDLILRRWQLLTPTCTKNIADVIPSVPLLATSLLFKKDTQELKQNMHDCSQFQKNFQQVEFKINDDLIFDLNANRLNNRILFTIPWYLNPGETLPQLSNGRNLLTIMSAKKILEKPSSFDRLHDSITIIGGSNIEGRDWHITPLGWMPGILILVNSIQSLLQYGVLQPPSNWWILLFATILIVSTSFLLIKCGKIWGAVYSTFLIIILIPLSFVLFKYGIWLSFVIPWLAVQFRQIIDF
ncbi:MAG: CHASE2 domain-containing protein, partial [Proteobacteria bacterium]|nr:CHASE2 domain-containing protein [Pseudomonadota bacterium]